MTVLNTDIRIGKNLPDFVRQDEAPVTRYDSGPYVGVVKDNRDPTRSGRLQVYIPDFGGDHTRPQNWRTVWYASPFFGYTTQEDINNGGSKENKYSKVRHSYGIWFPVPDIGNFVICTFISGDPGRGYWFACIPNQLGHHMVPAISSSLEYDKDGIEDSKVSQIIEDGNAYPVAEFNENNEDVKWETFIKEKKPIHEPQVLILLEQGTDRNKLTGSRGAIFSTSQRETPSTVFGITTPGRPKEKFPDQDAKVTENRVGTRVGGHGFVMDDGDKDGKNNLTRWRSAGGHTILMDDSEKFMYIQNSSGTCWIELTNEGYMNIWASNSINVRTKKDFNFQVDGDMNVQVDGNINIRGKKNFNVEILENTTVRTTKKTHIFSGDIEVGSESFINLHAQSTGSWLCDSPLRIEAPMTYINSGPGPQVKKPKDIPRKKHPETKKDGTGKWVVEENKIDTVPIIVPTHEPWPRKSGIASPASNAPQDGGGDGGAVGGGEPPSGDPGQAGGQASATSGTGGAVTDSQGKPAVGGGGSSGGAGIESAKNSPTTRAAPENLMNRSDAPSPSKGVGNLSTEQTKGLYTQIAYNESGMDYKSTNQYGYVGRYQMGAAALVDSGHIHRSAYEQMGNKALENPSSWTGKDGMRSKQDFLNSPSVQERTMEEYTERNYNSLVRNGGIKPGDSPETVGGMLQTAHLLGAGGANKWRSTGSGADAFGTTGSSYYNRGRYGVSVLGDRA